MTVSFFTPERIWSELVRRGLAPETPGRWSYFFEARDPDPLQALGERLSRSGYEVMELFEPGAHAEAEPVFLLRLDRDETHTAQTLAVRFGELHALAAAASATRFVTADRLPDEPDEPPFDDAE